jgi:flagellar hook assembly protein FlgD
MAFDVPRAGVVELSVHDLAGRRVRTLASGTLAAGRHTLAWDGADDGGRRVHPGVYLLRLADGERVQTRRVSFIP